MSVRSSADRRENHAPDSMCCCSSLVRACIFMRVVAAATRPAALDVVLSMRFRHRRGAPMNRDSIVFPSRRSQVSPEEWQLRCDLAAAYRLVALFKWDDLVFTHISARVPGPDEH